MAPLALYLCGAAAVAFAVLMVLQRSLYLSAICLLAVLLQAAALFFIAGAPLLAFLQIMIYAGAVMVLIVVTIMAAPSPEEPAASRFARLSLPWPLAAAGLVLPLVEVFLLLSRGGAAAVPARGASVELSLGPVLFGPFAVATEAVTLLMFLSALALAGRGARSRRGRP